MIKEKNRSVGPDIESCDVGEIDGSLSDTNLKEEAETRSNGR